MSHVQVIEILAAKTPDFRHGECQVYSIAHLRWNSKESYWKFSSVGVRYLEDGDTELNKWLLDFCNKYTINGDGELVEIEIENKL